MTSRQNRPTRFRKRFFRNCAHQSGLTERKNMIDPNHKLSATRQAKMLGMYLSTAYYRPKGPSDADMAWMALLDRPHVDYQFAGARMLRDLLQQRGHVGIGRRRIRGLMQLMGGGEAITSQPHPVIRYIRICVGISPSIWPIRSG